MKLPAIPDRVSLPAQGGIERRVHLFDPDSRNAILAAIGAARPLLVRGEPGVGKTQLAEAAAVALQRRLLTTVVDSRTEPRDLLYSFDAVARLAEAQLCGAAPKSSETDLHAARELLTPKRFLTPGPLWWAFDWKSARDQAELSGAPRPYSDEQWEAASGTVLLIDEIDKAETDVPNGLLEALGSRQFTPPFDHQPVAQTGECPLVVITTNEERALPDPFLRRCVVLDLKPPG
ncbi:MAG TPA: MoxR family ATPase, partial [Pirellulaceae bacterium]|nr:MoxR family ATPase [Pirellulaceae bacterium]